MKFIICPNKEFCIEFLFYLIYAFACVRICANPMPLGNHCLSYGSLICRFYSYDGESDVTIFVSTNIDSNEFAFE